MDDNFVPDETPKGPDKEANEKALRDLHASYEKAFQEEWDTQKEREDYDEGKLEPEQIRDKTKELLTQAVPKAIGSLLYLSQHAGNESVRLKAATYIVDKAIGKESGFVGDPLEELLRGISK